MQADGVGGQGRARSPDELWAGLVAEVATMPDVVANLLREHRPDEHGLCLGNGCGTAGRGVPTTRWPCSLHQLATHAQQARRAATSRERPTAGERASGPPGRAEPARPPFSAAVAWVLYGRRGPTPGAPPTSAADS